MNKKAKLFSGEVDIVTFDEFIKLIPLREIEPGTRIVYYNTQISAPSLEALATEDSSLDDVAFYETSVSPLYHGELGAIVKSGILYKATSKYYFKQSPRAFFEKLCTESLYNFGVPTHMVKIAPRVWLAANPEDYEIIRNDEGIGVLCLAKYRNVLSVMLKITEEDAKNIVASYTDSGA